MLKSKRVFLISIFTILISMAMLISATFAWFTSTVSTNANAVKSATYNITAAITKEDSTSINPTTENNVTSIAFPSTGTYNVTVTPSGNANNGYCIVNFKNTDYYTENLTSGSFTFAVSATENDVLTITSNWGTYSSDITNILNNDNKTIGTASNSGGGQTQNTANLLSGNNFNTKLKENAVSATALVFTDISVPENTTTTDYSVNQDGSILGWFVNKTYYISSLESGKKIVANEDASYMFADFSGLTSIDLSNLDTSSVTNMLYMFNGTGLTSLDLSNFDTSKVTNMVHMFNNVSSLTSLDISNFDFSNVTDMSYMFSLCTNLTEVLVKDEATRVKLVGGETNISDTSYIKVKTTTQNSNSQENPTGSN